MLPHDPEQNDEGKRAPNEHEDSAPGREDGVDVHADEMPHAPEPLRPIVITGVDLGSKHVAVASICNGRLLFRRVYKLADVNARARLSPAETLAEDIAGIAGQSDHVAIEGSAQAWGQTPASVSAVSRHLIAAEEVGHVLHYLLRAAGVDVVRTTAVEVRREVIPGVRSGDADAHVWPRLAEDVEGWATYADEPALDASSRPDAADACAAAVWLSRKLAGTLRKPKAKSKPARAGKRTRRDNGLTMAAWNALCRRKAAERAALEKA